MADKKIIDTVLGRKDWRQKCEEMQEEIRELEHQQTLRIAQIKREDERTNSELADLIAKKNAELDNFRRLQFTDADLVERRHVLTEEEDKLNHREKLLDEREKHLESRYNAKETSLNALAAIRIDEYVTKISRLDDRMVRLDNQESDLAESARNKGYNDGFTAGLTLAETNHAAALKSKDELLNLHVVGSLAQKPQTFVVSTDKDAMGSQSDASKALADAFAKHLTKTVDKALSDDKDKK